MSNSDNAKIDPVKELHIKGTAVSDKYGRKIIITDKMIGSAFHQLKGTIVKPCHR